MKGSTLHRSGLTREKMGVLANLTQADKKQDARVQLNQYYRATKAQELDILWGGVQRGIQKVHSATRTVSQKSPATYLTIGFVAGVLFMCLIILIVSISSRTPKAASIDSKANVAVIGSEVASDDLAPIITQEKYIVKKGDTLNGIAYRFYGRYNEAKIMEIQKINNISNPAALSIGQQLIIPVSQER